jgi:hypothetical protein
MSNVPSLWDTARIILVVSQTNWVLSWLVFAGLPKG